jgi:hypothetical protein
MTGNTKISGRVFLSKKPSSLSLSFEAQKRFSEFFDSILKLKIKIKNKKNSNKWMTYS